MGREDLSTESAPLAGHSLECFKENDVLSVERWHLHGEIWLLRHYVSRLSCQDGTNTESHKLDECFHLSKDRPRLEERSPERLAGVTNSVQAAAAGLGEGLRAATLQCWESSMEKWQQMIWLWQGEALACPRRAVSRQRDSDAVPQKDGLVSPCARLRRAVAGDCSLESCKPSPFSLPLLSGKCVPWTAIFRLLFTVWFPPGMLSRFWELQLPLGQHERRFAFRDHPFVPQHLHQLCCPLAAALAWKTPPHTPCQGQQCQCSWDGQNGLSQGRASPQVHFPAPGVC